MTATNNTVKVNLLILALITVPVGTLYLTGNIIVHTTYLPLYGMVYLIWIACILHLLYKITKSKSTIWILISAILITFSLPTIVFLYIVIFSGTVISIFEELI